MNNIFLLSFFVGCIVSGLANYVLIWRNTLRLRERLISEVDKLEKEIDEQIRTIGKDELKKTRAGQKLLRELQTRVNKAEMEDTFEQTKLEAEQDNILREELASIQDKKVALVQEINRTQIRMLATKINLLKSVFDVTSQEFENRIEQEIPKKLDEIRQNAKYMSPQELYTQLNDLMAQMYPVLDDLPANLGELRNQFIRATDELEMQTRNLLENSKNDSDNKIVK